MPCNATTNSVISADTPVGALGQATQARSAREIQYGLKVIF